MLRRRGRTKSKQAFDISREYGWRKCISLRKVIPQQIAAPDDLSPSCGNVVNCTVIMSKSSKSKNMTAVTYSHAREHLAEIWDSIEDAQRPVVLHRRGHQDMALLPADELVGLEETAHLLRSPKNAAR